MSWVHAHVPDGAMGSIARRSSKRDFLECADRPGLISNIHSGFIAWSALSGTPRRHCSGAQTSRDASLRADPALGPLPHLRSGRTGPIHPYHICTGTGHTAPTSAAGLGSPLATSAAGTGLTPAHICTGLGAPLPTSAPGLGHAGSARAQVQQTLMLRVHTQLGEGVRPSARGCRMLQVCVCV